jgi:uncharacterized protein with ATP-grasp and redox domains
MHVSIECYPCLLNQVLATVDLCDLEESEKKEVMSFALSQLAARSDNMYPQEIVVAVNEYLVQRFALRAEKFDPYKSIKRRSREIALAFYGSIEERITSAQSPLEFAVKCAALGNIIDYGAKAHGRLDISTELERVDELDFSVYDYGAFLETFKRSDHILYLGDNVGEDVFDKALIQAMKRDRPTLTVTFAARERPVINDVTLADARAVGMDKVARIISSGSVYPGTIMSKTSSEFQELFDAADLVIAKGQGNFETLNDVAHPALFFLLRAKCDKVARAIGVGQGSMILKKQPKMI